MTKRSKAVPDTCQELGALADTATCPMPLMPEELSPSK